MQDLADVIDGQRLEALRNLGARAGRDLLSELLAMFLDQTPGRLQELRQAQSEADLSRVERAAHALKGSCANLGVSELARLSSQLEISARQGDQAGFASLIDAVEAEYERVAAIFGTVAASPPVSPHPG